MNIHHLLLSLCLDVWGVLKALMLFLFYLNTGVLKCSMRQSDLNF